MIAYVLIICATINGGESCAPNYMAFDNYQSCERARSSLKGEFLWAQCQPEGTVAIPAAGYEEEE